MAGGATRPRPEGEPGGRKSGIGHGYGFVVRPLCCRARPRSSSEVLSFPPPRGKSLV
jgi:hypothetical protein